AALAAGRIVAPRMAATVGPARGLLPLAAARQPSPAQEAVARRLPLRDADRRLIRVEVRGRIVDRLPAAVRRPRALPEPTHRTVARRDALLVLGVADLAAIHPEARQLHPGGRG